jgi:hypothetical protein
MQSVEMRGVVIDRDRRHLFFASAPREKSKQEYNFLPQLSFGGIFMIQMINTCIRVLALGIAMSYLTACDGEISVSGNMGIISGNAYVGVGPNGPYGGGSVSIHAGASSVTVSGKTGTTTSTTPATPKAHDAVTPTATANIEGSNYTGDVPTSQVPMTSNSVSYSASNVRAGSY